MKNHPLLLALAIALSSGVQAGECSFATWIDFNAARLLRNDAVPAYVFAASETKIDADGAPNAYHPDDVALHCTKGVGFKGLDCPANAGYPHTNWWQSVIVADPKRPERGFVQPPGAEFAGYFVTQTTLTDSTKPATDPRRYVDSRFTPYLVFPGAFRKLKGTGDMGDIGFALNTANGKASEFLVADAGPSDAKLGEMSIALATALGGTQPNPRTGSGAPSGKILFMVFPRSRHQPAWPVSAAALAAKSQGLLDKAGGMAALSDCKDAL